MARLFGIGILLWAVYLSISYSLANAPGSAEPDVDRPVSSADIDADAAGTDDVDTDAPGALPFAEPSSASLTRLSPAPNAPGGEAFAAGSYEVGDSPVARIAARDRDHRPRTSFTADNERTPDVVAESVDFVKGEIEPGLYATRFETSGCGYELWRVMRDRTWKVIGQDEVAEGRMLVTINGIEPDRFVSTLGCENWYRWEPLDQPLTVADNGDYWVGDLAWGTWTVPIGCQWEKVSGFRGSQLSDAMEVGASGLDLVVDADTFGVRIRNCSTPISLSVPEYPYETRPPD